MRIHLVNPSDTSFGIGVITPRWLYVLAAATPAAYGDPVITDETLEQIQPELIQRGDIVGIGIHTGNALRGMEVGRVARERGALVVYGGIHATLYPDEAFELGGAHAVVKGDGDVVWARVISDLSQGRAQAIYDGGRVSGERFLSARWDLAPRNRYMWASVQTVRGCPKHCSFCSVWRTDGQKPRQRASDVVIEEIVQLRRLGFRFIALADDNFYPVTLTDIRLAEKQGNVHRVGELQAMRSERFELMEKLAKLPSDMVFFTQITMEAGEDSQFLDAMCKARIKGALVGVESVTAEGLKAVFKEFNSAGPDLSARLSTFKEHGVHVLGSFIFGLPSDRADTFAATAALAKQANLTFAQFVMMTPFPRHRRLRSVGEEYERERSSRGRNSNHEVLADSRQSAAEDVHSAQNDDHRGNHRTDAEGLGQLLQPAGDLESVQVRAHAARAAGVPFHFQVISSNVCEHRYFDRQRPSAEGDPGGTLAGRAVPEIIRSETDARARSAAVAGGFGVDFDHVLRGYERTAQV